MNIDLDSYLDHQIIPFAISLYIIGVFLKRTAIIPNRFIPWILLSVSCAASVIEHNCCVLFRTSESDGSKGRPLQTVGGNKNGHDGFPESN